MAKDDTFVDEPADKLYNEGCTCMNQKKDPKAASKKFEKSIVSILTPSGRASRC